MKYPFDAGSRPAASRLARLEPLSDRAPCEASFVRSLATLWLAWQPIVVASGHEVFGHEALLRTGEPALASPAAVLGAAERLERLVELGRAVRSRVVERELASPRRGYLFVNVDTRELADGALAARDAPLSAIASRVVLEITERAAPGDLRVLRRRLAELRELGFRIAVDDLGAGHASLASLRAVDPDFVKLDRSLVADIHRRPFQRKLVAALVASFRDAGKIVVAEGIELEAEREILVALGCDLLQGFLFARPGP